MNDSSNGEHENMAPASGMNRCIIEDAKMTFIGNETVFFSMVLFFCLVFVSIFVLFGFYCCGRVALVIAMFVGNGDNAKLLGDGYNSKLM